MDTNKIYDNSNTFTTGLWNEYKKLNKENWDFLVNRVYETEFGSEIYQKTNKSLEQIVDEGNDFVTENDFLHGHCDIFAEAIYNSDPRIWTIESVHSQESGVGHTYCVANIHGVEFFADVRGVTNNWEDFIKDFEKGMTKNQDLPTTDREQLKEMNCISIGRHAVAYANYEIAAKIIIEDNINNYKIEKLRELAEKHNSIIKENQKKEPASLIDQINEAQKIINEQNKNKIIIKKEKNQQEIR